MTLTQILNQTGKFNTHKDASKIGHLIATAAREKNIEWTKVTEVVTVNDYPDSFVEEMKEIIASYYQKKNEITKRVMKEMAVEKKPVDFETPETPYVIPLKEKTRKRIPKK